MNDSIIFQTQQVTDGDKPHQSNLSMQKKLKLKTDKETLFGKSGQEHREDYHGSNTKAFPESKNVNMLCQPHSASSIIQKNGVTDISPVLASGGTKNQIGVPKLTINTTAESHYLINQIQQATQQIAPNQQKNIQLFKMQTEQQKGVLQNEAQFSRFKQPISKNDNAQSSPCTSRKIKAIGVMLKNEPVKQDKKRQSTFTCYNNNQVESLRNFIQNEQHFGSSLSSVQGKNSLNDAYKLQGTSLLQDYSQQKAFNHNQLKLVSSVPNECPGQFHLQSVDQNHNGQVQSPHDSSVNKSNLSIVNHLDFQSQLKTKQSNLQAKQQITYNDTEIKGIVSKLHKYSEGPNNKANKQNSIISRKSNLNQNNSHAIDAKTSLPKSCSRRDKQIMNSDQNVIDYCHEQQYVVTGIDQSFESQFIPQQKPLVAQQSSHNRNSMLILGSILDRRDSTEATMAVNGRGSQLAGPDAVVNGVKVQSSQLQHHMYASRAKDQYSASMKSTTNPTLLQRASSINSDKNQLESVPVNVLDDNRRQQQSNKSNRLNQQQINQINCLNQDPLNKLQHDCVHFSGEQTLKSQNCNYDHLSKTDQLQNSQLIKAINDNLQLQQKCIEIFENNQQLLSQLNHYGKSQRSDLDSQSQNRKQSQLTIASHHNSTAPSVNNGINQQNLFDQICRQKSSKQQFYEEQTTGATTFNKRSQDELLSHSKTANKKVMNFKQKNHQKFMSLGQGILYPKSYLDKTQAQIVGSAATSNIDASNKLNEPIKDSAIISSTRTDQRQSSVLIPDFMDRNCAKDQLTMPISSSTSKYQGLKNSIGTANFQHSVERTQRKSCGAQNKIASMNGQIILNLNQSIFRNMNQQLLSKQLNLNPINHEQNQLMTGLSNQKIAETCNDQRSSRASPRKIRGEGLHSTQRLTSSLQNCHSRHFDGRHVFQDMRETNSTKVITQLENYHLKKDQ